MSQLLKSKNEEEDALDRNDASPVHRGMAIACCCVAIASLTPVVLVQLRVIKRLPDLPGRLFDSKRIVMSKSAYRFGIPDGILGLGSYSITLVLLIAAKPSRPLLQGVLRGKLMLDGTAAARKTRRQVKEFGRICSWCMGAAIATAGVVYFSRKARELERIHRA